MLMIGINSTTTQHMRDEFHIYKNVSIYNIVSLEKPKATDLTREHIVSADRMKVGYKANKHSYLMY